MKFLSAKVKVFWFTNHSVVSESIAHVVINIRHALKMGERIFMGAQLCKDQSKKKKLATLAWRSGGVGKKNRHA